MLAIGDFLLISAAVFISLFLRFEGNIPEQYVRVFIASIPIVTLLKIFIYYLLGIYSSLWRNASIDELIRLFIATLAGEAAAFIYGYLTNSLLPRSVYLISWLIVFLLIGSSRLSYRILRRLRNIGRGRSPSRKRVMVIGAGSAGSMVIKELRDAGYKEYEPVAVIDDDRYKHRMLVHGVPVKGGRDMIQEVARKDRIDEIIIAMPSADRREVSKILNICKETKCRLKTLPGVCDILDGKVRIEQLRDVDIEDLLGREVVELNTEEMAGYLEGEVVLVTGGGGSIGSELCRQIARFNPKKLIIFDIYENCAYDLQNELIQNFRGSLDLVVAIGSVREKKRLEEVFAAYRPGVVFHAAAHKHVPLMELNPGEAVKNNVFGTLYTAQCAHEFKTKKFVLISTDKAVNPSNIMGATKRAAEMIIQSMDRISETEYAAVRFGNVLGSNGSVIPLFKKQIESGGPVTVTHPDITRFFMTISEAVSLVIQAGAMAKGGEVFILDMGEPVKILDLAKDLIRLSGYEPGEDIKIKFTGLRPGEKLYEELMLAEEGITATRHSKIFVGKPLDIDHGELLRKLETLEAAIGDEEKIRQVMAMIVPTYSYAMTEIAAAAEEEAEE